jgi:peptidylprolyl isomerase
MMQEGNENNQNNPEEKQNVPKAPEENKPNETVNPTMDTPKSSVPGKRVVKFKLIYVVVVVVVAAALVGVFYFLMTGGSAAAVRTAQAGDNVSIYYAVYLSNGTLFQSDFGSTPISFVIDGGEMITGVNNAVIGMKVGQIKNVTVPPAEGYGYINETSRNITVPVSEVISLAQYLFGNSSNLSLGEHINYAGYTYIVLSYNATNSTLEAYPVLSGQTLTFKLELAGINGST